MGGWKDNKTLQQQQEVQVNFKINSGVCFGFDDDSQSGQQNAICIQLPTKHNIFNHILAEVDG